jgi:hypothetical protein
MCCRMIGSNFLFYLTSGNSNEGIWSIPMTSVDTNNVVDKLGKTIIGRVSVGQGPFFNDAVCF